MLIGAEIFQLIHEKKNIQMFKNLIMAVPILIF